MSGWLLEQHRNYKAYQAIEGQFIHNGQGPIHIWEKEDYASKTDDLMDAWLQVRVV